MDKPFDPVSDKPFHIEIYQQANSTSGQPQVRKHLRDVDLIEALDRFDFYNHCTLDQQIEAVPAIQRVSAVGEGSGFCRSMFKPLASNSKLKHASYADSSRPGPSSRCTASEAAMISYVSAFSRSFMRLRGCKFGGAARPSGLTAERLIVERSFTSV
jgi:hypothetical protein